MTTNISLSSVFPIPPSVLDTLTVPAPNEDLDEALCQIEDQMETLQKNQTAHLNSSPLKTVFSSLENTIGVMKNPNTPIGDLQASFNDLIVIERTVEDYLDLIRKIYESKGNSAITIDEDLSSLLKRILKDTSIQEDVQPITYLQTTYAVIRHPIQTISTFFSNPFSVKYHAQHLREKFFHKIRSLARFLEEFEIHPQRDSTKELALKRELEQIKISNEKAEREMHPTWKRLFYLVTGIAQISQAAISASHKPSLDRVYQTAANRVIEEPSSRLENEVRFLETTLRHHQTTICPMKSDAFQRFTIRYPETRELLHSTCLNPIDPKTTDQVLRDYRAHRASPQLLPPQAWQNAFCTPQTPTTDSPSFDLRELEGRMAHIPKPSSFSPNPSIPEKSYPINQTAAQNWIHCHCTERGREIAQKYIRNLHHVPHETFEARLAASIEDLNQRLEQNNHTKFTMTFPDTAKSNYWVSQLATKYLKNLPQKIAKYDRLSFPTDLPIVVFDDAIYSGFQMSEFLKTIQDKSPPNTFLGYVVVPYAAHTKWSLKLQNNPSFVVTKHERMPLLKELFTPSELEELKSPSSEMVATYFDHKIADGQSFCCSRWLGHGFPFSERGECPPNRTRCTYTPFVKEPTCPY